MKKKESIGYVVLFTFAVCLIFVSLLAVANQLTLSRVEANRRYATRIAVLKAFGLADSTTPRAEVESMYEEKIEERRPPSGMEAAFSADIDGASFVAVRVTSPGLWGPITAILASDPTAERVLGLEILEQQETPGLGGRIGEAWFMEQFAGEKVGLDGKILVSQGTGKGDADKENSRVDAVTGASRTSDFIQRLVNLALDSMGKIGGTL
jgi:Na+-transporting NADH:ubiquinone oxidoreductase subunit C